MTKCVVCGKSAETNSSTEMIETNVIKCKQCRSIIILNEDFYNGEDRLKNRACLHYYFTHFKVSNSKPYRIVSDTSIVDDRYNIISEQEIRNVWPNNLSERIDKILQNLAAVEKYIGIEIVFSLHKDEDYEYLKYVLFVENIDGNDEVFGIIKMLADQDYISDDSSDLQHIRIVIKYKGWQRIDELNRKMAKHNQGFIAMMFSSCTEEVKSTIKEAIKNAGYHPQIMDDFEHNHQIVPEMLYQISMSDFLVADLTGNRGGVYFEAGYALALDKQVIFTVDNRILDKEKILPESERTGSPHFDVAQYKQIRYSSMEDLKAQLYKRIEATVGLRI